MRLRFIGTGIGAGAARVENRRRRLLKDHRRAPALLLDDRLLIGSTAGLADFEETFSFGGLSRAIDTLLLPHSESLDIPSLEALAATHPVTLYGTAAIAPLVEGIGGVTFSPLTPYRTHPVADLRVLPLPAAYATADPRELCLHFLLMGTRHLFYAVDGGWLYPATFSVLAELTCQAAVLDCGLGDGPFCAESFRHNNLSMATHLREAMLSGGCLSGEGAPLLLSCLPTVKRRELHAELCPLAEAQGMKVAYDGLFLNL